MSARVVLGFALSVAACVADAEPREIELTELREGFQPVSSMLGARCGSLDCHGQAGRRFRLYSSRGLRLADDDTTGHGGTRTAEHDANLASTTALEPELFARVIAEHGREPYRLTLLRKATGREAHLGGTVLSSDDPGVTCLTAWLAQSPEETACDDATQASEREP